MPPLPDFIDDLGHSIFAIDTGFQRPRLDAAYLMVHGGQVSLMDIVARELRSRCGLIVYSCSWWNLPLGDVRRLTAPDPKRSSVVLRPASQLSLATITRQVLAQSAWRTPEFRLPA